MIVARTLADLAEALAGRPRPVALVPTMGALHAGHLSLLAAARNGGATVVASVFVNPAQFNAADDLARYPRDEAGDLAALEAGGCDLAWLPEVATMYPPGDCTRVTLTGPAQGWEGDARPGHFTGVATVVAKLFGQVRPDLALFGEKDWQQLQVVRRLVADLCLGIGIVGVPTFREADGLAMSSRNRFLDTAERRQAPLLYGALRRTATALARTAAIESIGQAQQDLVRAGFTVEYLALVDADTLAPTRIIGGSRLIAAARLGTVRLLDNVGTEEPPV